MYEVNTHLIHSVMEQNLKRTSTRELKQAGRFLLSKFETFRRDNTFKIQGWLVLPIEQV